MALQGITVVSIPVLDQNRAKRFYADRLGFDVVLEAEFAHGMRWVEVRPPMGGVSIALVTWFDRMPPGSVQGLVLASDDVRSDQNVLRWRGVRFGQEVEDAPWGSFTTFEDPDGNSWVLQEPRRRATSITCSGSELSRGRCVRCAPRGRDLSLAECARPSRGLLLL